MLMGITVLRLVWMRHTAAMGGSSPINLSSAMIVMALIMTGAAIPVSSTTAITVSSIGRVTVLLVS